MGLYDRDYMRDNGDGRFQFTPSSPMFWYVILGGGLLLCLGAFSYSSSHNYSPTPSNLPLIIEETNQIVREHEQDIQAFMDSYPIRPWQPPKKTSFVLTSNFDNAFTPDKLIETDQGKARVLIKNVGQLHLPSGELKSFDPIHLFYSGKNSYHLKALPGTYPVEIAQIQHGIRQPVTTCLRIKFSQRDVKKYWPATEYPDIKGWPQIHYSVGSEGMWSGLIDASYLNDLEQFDGKKRALLMNEIEKRTATNIKPMIVLSLTGKNQNELALLKLPAYDYKPFPAYWGLDSDGQPVCFIIDYLRLGRNIETLVEIPLKSDFLNRSIEHPLLRKHGLQVAINHPREGRLGFYFINNRQCELTVFDKKNREVSYSTFHGRYLDSIPYQIHMDIQERLEELKVVIRLNEWRAY